MQPLEKLLRKLKREGTRLPPWMMPLGHEVITYDGVRYAHKGFIKTAEPPPEALPPLPIAGVSLPMMYAIR